MMNSFVHVRLVEGTILTTFPKVGQFAQVLLPVLLSSVRLAIAVCVYQIDRKTGQVKVLLDGLGFPHSVRPRPAGDSQKLFLQALRLISQ